MLKPSTINLFYSEHNVANEMSAQFSNHIVAWHQSRLILLESIASHYKLKLSEYSDHLTAL